MKNDQIIWLGKKHKNNKEKSNIRTIQQNKNKTSTKKINK